MRPAERKFRKLWDSKLVGEEKTGTISGPGLLLAGCPDKSRELSFEFQVSINSAANAQQRNLKLSSYALLLGLTVKSRTWVRMLDICIPFSCETKGKSSAIN